MKRTREDLRTEMRDWLEQHLGIRSIEGEPISVAAADLDDDEIDELLQIARGTQVRPYAWRPNRQRAFGPGCRTDSYFKEEELP